MSVNRENTLIGEMFHLPLRVLQNLVVRTCKIQRIPSVARCITLVTHTISILLAGVYMILGYRDVT